MTNSFLDKAGLTYLWSKITALVNTKQNTLTFDSTPTANSTNPVTSAGIKAYVDENAGGGGNSPVESGTGVGSVQTKAYSENGVTYTQLASGRGAFAEGSDTQAKGAISHAEGIGTIANGLSQHVEGRFNIADTSNQYAHITGIGSSDFRRLNGFTVDWSGNGVFSGKVSVGNSYSASAENDLITKGFFAREIYPTILEESTDVDNYGVYPMYADPDVTWSGHFLICYDSEVGDNTGYVNLDSPPIFSKILLKITQPPTHGGSDDDTIYLPLTKYAEFYVNDIPGYFQRMVFGNNERVYVADESGHFFLESEYPYPSGS